MTETPTEPPVGAAIDEACRWVWARIGEPGTWWTGQQRVSIAAETRTAWNACPLCRARKAAVSPYGVEGSHGANEALPAAAVDAVHRVTTDPGRLTRRWFDDVLAGGLTVEQFVELIGVLSTVVAVDSFRRGIGAPLFDLPRPLAGEPSRIRLSDVIDGAWVPLVPKATHGPLAAEFARQGPGPTKALGCVPEEQLSFLLLKFAMYPPRAHAERTISSAQSELIATTVSAVNECFY